MIEIFTMLFATPWILAMGCMAWGTWVVLRQYPISSRPLKDSSETPPVTIIKPLKGVDYQLKENLESFFQIKYPEFEILFCTAPNDPALTTLAELFQQYPHVNARLLVTQSVVGINPKVNNMYLAYQQARYDHLWISDSNVRVTPDALNHMIHYLSPKVGAVTAVISGVAGKGAGGLLETLFLNTFYARWMYTAGALGIPFIVGKLMLLKKSTLERCGGLATFGCYIAEDYMTGLAIKKLGLDIVIMNEPVVQVVGHISLSTFWKRHVRWGRIRKYQNQIAFLLEPWMGSIASGITGMAVFFFRLGISPMLFLIFHFFTWFVCDLCISYRMNRTVSPFQPLMWIARELCAIPLWIQIVLGNTVDWRGNRLRILPGGLVTQ